MKRRKLPPTEYLRECFIYDEHSGLLYWKARPVTHFFNARIWASCNSRLTGKQAFTYVHPGGHYFGAIDGVNYQAHRVVWKLVTGEEPPTNIDHRDRNGLNNRVANLRAATDSQNQINRVGGWGKAKIKGVRPVRGGKWEARIHKDGRYYHLGTFAEKAEAIACRNQATVAMYGEFSP
jgi:hypothetical protein